MPRIPLEKLREGTPSIPEHSFLFPVAQTAKHLPADAGDLGLIPGSGRSLGEGNGYPLCPGGFHGQGSLVGYSPQGCKESDTTEQLTLALFILFESVIVIRRG